MIARLAESLRRIACRCHDVADFFDPPPSIDFGEAVRAGDTSCVCGYPMADDDHDCDAPTTWLDGHDDIPFVDRDPPEVQP